MNLKEDHPLWKEFLIIRKSGERAEKLIHQLLVFSRKQIFEHKIINVNMIITDFEKNCVGLSVKI